MLRAGGIERKTTPAPAEKTEADEAHWSETWTWEGDS